MEGGDRENQTPAPPTANGGGNSWPADLEKGQKAGTLQDDQGQKAVTLQEDQGEGPERGNSWPRWPAEMEKMIREKGQKAGTLQDDQGQKAETLQEDQGEGPERGNSWPRWPEELEKMIREKDQKAETLQDDQSIEKKEEQTNCSDENVRPRKIIRLFGVQIDCGGAANEEEGSAQSNVDADQSKKTSVDNTTGE